MMLRFTLLSNRTRAARCRLLVVVLWVNLPCMCLPSVLGQTVLGQTELSQTPLGLSATGFNSLEQSNVSPFDSSMNQIGLAAGLVPASAVEVQDVVRQLQAAIRDKDVFAFEKVFNQTAYVDRVLDTTSIAPAERAQFEAGMIAQSTFTAMGIDAIQHGAEFTFLRLVRRENEVRPLFRMIPATPQGRAPTAVKYKEFVIRKAADNTIGIVDCCTTADGFSLSQFTHLLAVGGLSSNPDPSKRPTGVDQEILKASPALGEVTLALAAGNLSAALQAAAKVPPPLSTDSRILALKCSIAKRVSGPRYRDAVLEYARMYPLDCEADLYLLDLYVEQPNDQRLFQVVDRLIDVYQDPYLHSFKVAGLLRQNRTKEALASIDAARAAAPDRAELAVAEVGVRMKMKNHAVTAKAIAAAELKFGDRVFDLSVFPDFREFADSAEGQACLARRLGFIK